MTRTRPSLVLVAGPPGPARAAVRRWLLEAGHLVIASEPEAAHAYLHAAAASPRAVRMPAAVIVVGPRDEHEPTVPVPVIHLHEIEVEGVLSVTLRSVLPV